MKFLLDVDLWRRVVNSVRRIDEKPIMVFEPAGLSVVAVDRAHVSLLRLSLKKEVFAYYDVEERDRTCFNLDDLSKYVAGAAGVADVTIEETVKIMMPSSFGFKSFTLPTYELGEEEAIVPTGLPHTSRCKVDVGALQMAVKDAKRVKSEYVTFRVNEERLEAVSKGEKASSLNKYGMKAVVRSDFTEGDEVMLTAENLEKVLGAGGEFTNIVLMCFSGEILPIELTFQLPFEGICKGWIAPCVPPD